MKTNTFIFVWDSYGLETCINLTELEQNQLLDILKDKPSQSISQLLNSILLRAKFNCQRHYEIYSCQVDSSITRNELIKMFSNNPQQSADTIRQLGTEIYSDRADKTKVLIT